MIINLLVGCLINISCHLDSLPNDNARRSNTCNEHYKWDNANLYDFYYASSSFFDHFSVDCYYACSLGFDCNGHHHSIDNLYKDIVHALQQAERLTVSPILYNGLNPFWNGHLDELKEKSVFWVACSDAGRPRSDELFKLKSDCATLEGCSSPGCNWLRWDLW